MFLIILIICAVLAALFAKDVFLFWFILLLNAALYAPFYFISRRKEKNKYILLLRYSGQRSTQQYNLSFETINEARKEVKLIFNNSKDIDKIYIIQGARTIEHYNR